MTKENLQHSLEGSWDLEADLEDPPLVLPRGQQPSEADLWGSFTWGAAELWYLKHPTSNLLPPPPAINPQTLMTVKTLISKLISWLGF